MSAIVFADAELSWAAKRAAMSAETCAVFSVPRRRRWLPFDNLPYGGGKRSGTRREAVRYAEEELFPPKVLLVRQVPNQRACGFRSTQRRCRVP